MIISLDNYPVERGKDSLRLSIPLVGVAAAESGVKDLTFDAFFTSWERNHTFWLVLILCFSFSFQVCLCVPFCILNMIFEPNSKLWQIKLW